MILFNKNAVNNICPTLYEKTTLDPVYYLFEFENDQTKVKYYCIPTELSTELLRYNEFDIEDKTNPVALNGEVDLPIGTYTYKVYEQSSSTNLDPTGLDVVEEDILQVKDSSTYTNTTYSPDLENTYYEG
jgi:hypothetical protein